MVQSADWINRARSIERIDQATEQDQLRSTERIVRTIEFLIAKAIVNPDRDPLNRPDNEGSSDCKRLIKECDRVPTAHQPLLALGDVNHQIKGDVNRCRR